MAYAALVAAAGEAQAGEWCDALIPDFAEQRPVIAQMIRAGLNSPLTTSMGRLFDAAAAVTGVCLENRHHAQAPMELEAAAAAAPGETGAYDVAVEPGGDGALVARTAGIIAALAGDRLAGVPPECCAARFHNTLARLTLDILRRIRDNGGCSDVALSGGVFANAVLVERLLPLLREAGFRTLMNRHVPPGDGGVSLGQAAVATWRLR
jgi:hydrogenase maturation protein HypF